MATRILVGDCRQTLKEIPSESVHCVVTSPPYWGLRSYKGDSGMIGLEETWDEHLHNLKEVFDEVMRVMRDDGTLWLNYGDAYASNNKSGGASPDGERRGREDTSQAHSIIQRGSGINLKPKNLMQMPARLAIAMQDWGWLLRSEIIWAKRNPMPESVKDRPTNAHEKIYLFAKNSKYYYDHVAVRTQSLNPLDDVRRMSYKTDDDPENRKRFPDSENNGIRNRSGADYNVGTANLRNVWSLATEAFKDAHFATFPTKLVQPCIEAGTSDHGVCGASGAPYERVYESELAKTQGPPPTDRSLAAGVDDAGSSRAKGGHVGGGNRLLIETLGWQPTCGAPYVRDVQYSGGTIGQSWHDHSDDLGKGQSGAQLGNYKVETKGWRPSCECEGETQPAIVLDPFGGSGTVSVVAERLGRDSIICEISPEYAEIARKRIEGEALPMFPTTIEVIQNEI